MERVEIGCIGGGTSTGGSSPSSVSIEGVRRLVLRLALAAPAAAEGSSDSE